MSFSAIKYLHYSPGFPLGPRGNDIFSDCSGNNPYIASGGLKFLIIILPPNHPQFMSHQNVAQKIFYGFKMIKRSGNFRDSVYSFQNIGGLMVCYYTSLKYFQSLERGILIIITVSGETILDSRRSKTWRMPSRNNILFYFLIKKIQNNFNHDIFFRRFTCGDHSPL